MWLQVSDREKKKKCRIAARAWKMDEGGGGKQSGDLEKSNISFGCAHFLGYWVTGLVHRIDSAPSSR